LNQTLRVLEICKSTWYYYQKEKVDYEQRYAHLRAPLLKAISEHPSYGWRKLQAELAEEYGIIINHKPLKKLLRIWELHLPRIVHKPRKNRIVKLIQEVGDRANLIKEKKTVKPLEVLLTDFTWLYYCNGSRKAGFISYKDLAGKAIYGYGLGESQDTTLALYAWGNVKKRLKKLGKELIVHQDQGSVFTAYEYIRQMVIKDGVRLSYSQKGTPGDNAAKESFIGHFKMENKSLFLSARTFKELKEVVKKRIQYYNKKRRHQSLGNLTPERYLKQWEPGLA